MLFHEKGCTGQLHLPVYTFIVKIRLERPAGRDKREIKNFNSYHQGQSKAAAILDGFRYKFFANACAVQNAICRL